jgi:hypothetical protein
VNAIDRERWARALVTAGWLITGSFLLVVIGQIRRAFAVQQASFEDGVWGQRVEQISVVALPQNLVILVPAAAAAVGATWLMLGSGLDQVPWTRQLVRVIAGVSLVTIVLAVLGILDVFAQSPDWVGGSIALLNRVGGVLMAWAMIRVCLESEGLVESQA